MALGHQFLFYLNPDDIAGDMALFSRLESHHISNVLRQGAGSEIEAADGAGTGYRVKLEARAAGCWRGKIIAQEIREISAPLPISLALPCLKRDRWEVALEAACEMGAEAIWLYDGALATVRWNRVRIERAQRKAVEALKQAGGGWLTRIDGPWDLPELLAHAEDGSLYLALPDAEPLPQLAGHVVLLIGPEAGWHEDEMAILRRVPCRNFSLGKRRLRSEIAALAALAQAAHSFIKS